jgi:hypothetical protein
MTKKLDNGKITELLIRDRPDLSTERAPHRDKTAN